MSSHREAPGISKDPLADNTDTYAWRTPNNTITIVTNYVPGESPAGGPNFYEFGDDVLYEIHIDNDGDAKPNITYQFRFNTTMQNPDTFLYNTGPIGSLTDPNWNRRQKYTLTKIVHGPSSDTSTVLGSNLRCPPCNIGLRSTPNYKALAQSAVQSLANDVYAFAGQRADPFFVDLGSIFDLGTLRPFEAAHLIPTANAKGVDTLKNSNVHTIAIRVPISHLTRDGSTPSDPSLAKSVVGVWGAASRQKGTVLNETTGGIDAAGPWVQVSRLGNPLFNEVITPMGDKDKWNRRKPVDDSIFTEYVKQPELAKLLPVLYPSVFPNLAGLSADRADLMAVLM